ncbi:MAG: PH domain-containing protein, partial [Candidatus Bathyarchaeum sp.]
QRLITQTGAIGLDTRYVDLEKIQEVNVNIGFIDKLFGTGNIFAPSASQASIGAIVTDSRFSYTQIIYRPNLAALKEPYKVQKLLQEAMKEVKLSSS